jgi:hypothetical protein
MQEARPKFETCGDPLDVTDPFSDLLQHTLIDVDPLANKLLDCRNTFPRCGDLNHQIAASHRLPQSPRVAVVLDALMRRIGAMTESRANPRNPVRRHAGSNTAPAQ